MPTGVFSNINSQTNLLANRTNQGGQKQIEQKTQLSKTVATAPVICEEEPDKKTKVLNAVKQAAPVVIPIVSVPVAAFVAYKFGTKNASEKIKNLENKIANFNIESVKAEAKNEVLTETKNSIESMKNTMYGLGVAVAGLTGINVAEKLKEDKGEENLDKDIKKELATINKI